MRKICNEIIYREIFMKKSLAVALSVALASVVAVTASGCNRSSKNYASLASNWYYDTSFKGIQPAFVGEENAEKLTYTITQSKPSANRYYSVEYTDGTYQTTFYAKEVTKADLAAITADDLYEGHLSKLGTADTMVVYYYATTLNMTVTYKLGSDVRTFDDSRTTEAYFMPVDNYLSPIYTKQVVKNVVPMQMQTSTLDYCYEEVDRVYESFYSAGGNEVKTVVTNNFEAGVIKEYKFKGIADDYSVFDAAYLDVAVRAMKNMSAESSQTVNVYSPGVGARQNIFTGVDKALLEDNNAAVEQLENLQLLLESNNLYVSKDPSLSSTDKTLNTLAVEVAYNGGSYSGVTQSYWFAALDSGVNTSRTLMLKYSVDLTFDHGRLDFVLSSVDNFPAI